MLDKDSAGAWVAVDVAAIAVEETTGVCWLGFVFWRWKIPHLWVAEWFHGNLLSRPNRGR